MREPLATELEVELPLEEDEAVGVLPVYVGGWSAFVPQAGVGQDELRTVDENADGRLGEIDQGLAGARHARAALRRLAKAVEGPAEALFQVDLRLPAELFTRA